jgi:tRNA G18 (ribose-2'-O)-methylase SpoU
MTSPNNRRKHTTPDLSNCSLTHARIIASGSKEYQSSWQYNVADHFKDKSTEEIRQTLRETAFPYAVCAEQICGDFNIGTIMRNANAFNARKFYYVGNKRFDKRGAVGTYHYLDCEWLETLDQLMELKKEYRFVGIDCLPRSSPIEEYQWNQKTPCLLIFGEEGVGLSTGMQLMCDDILMISMWGSVRSINVGTASGIAMHHLTSSLIKERQTNVQPQE